ncbi:BTB/POZ domain-containing protein 17-like [Latimeria chalumnae]|uniref:BTB domain-containing protein n=1 Tax=Latimeria chalumnae TaxID=7897 RepID=M3XLF9_LATCH|nr:PREDICTED: BTB/POZ domain-containing protein 17-like [Latimeria chalumnae]|eukprot:XP_006009073.1 PREDICTED: BTB/POZ domain-containing protein 17-like [Latimeria chalumnae]
MHAGHSFEAKMESKLISRLTNLFSSGDLSDVELLVNDSLSFKCHKFILAVQSEVFRVMFYNHHWKEAQKEQVTLTEDKRCVPYFRKFLEFLYTEQVHLTTEDALPLHLLAAKYNVEELQSRCEDFMLESVAMDRSLAHTISWFHYARQVRLRKLEEECGRFIAWNMDFIMKSPDWTSMDPDDLSSLLERSDLVVENELTLLEAVMEWLRIHPDYSEELIQHIRFPMMSPEEICSLQSYKGNIQRFHPGFESSCMLVYKANCLPMETIARHHDITSSSFTPRLYTSDKFGVRWQLSNWSQLGTEVTSTEFSTTVFKKSSIWEVNLFPYGGRVTQYSVGNQDGQLRIVTKTDKRELMCRVCKCQESESNHEHRLAVLIYQFANGNWIVRDVKELDVYDSSFFKSKIEDLVPKAELPRYIHEDTLTLHLIGQTFWKMEEENLHVIRTPEEVWREYS